MQKISNFKLYVNIKWFNNWLTNVCRMYIPMLGGGGGSNQIGGGGAALEVTG